MRIHLVGLPHTQTTSEYLSCAYTQKVIKFCRMMDGHHDVVLYAGEHNEAPCTEHVQLVSEDERASFFGAGFDTVKTPLLWDSSQPYWEQMNSRAITEIIPRMDERDLLLLIAGWAQKPIADGLPLMAVEWGIGYEGIFSRFCAFESYAWMHHVYGIQGWALGRFYDAVIPNFFDRNDFHLAETKGDYLLFVGRMIERKGPHIAAQIADRLNLNLLLAGPGAAEWKPGRIVCEDGTKIYGPVEYVGEVGEADRATLMSNARALIAPTLYVEPFGGVTVEAMLSGTPVVTTDFGAFTETVTPDVGRRFHTLSEAAEAVTESFTLDPAVIRESALARFSLEAIRPEYDRWFSQLQGLWGPGWDA